MLLTLTWWRSTSMRTGPATSEPLSSVISPRSLCRRNTALMRAINSRDEYGLVT